MAGGGDHLEIETDLATWTAFEEKTFINIMAKEVKRGNRHSTTFSRSSWAIIEQEFYEKTNRRYNHTQFRNKYNQLKIHYGWFSKLLKEPGFAWNPVLGGAVASDETWESYLKTNKKARRFRKKGCPMFNELVIIFGDSTTDFKDSNPFTQYPSLSDHKIDQENESTNTTPLALPLDSSGTGQDCLPHIITRKRQPSPTPTSNLHTNKEAKMERESPKDGIKVTVSNIKERSNPISEGTQMVKDLPSSFSITNCVKCLESIQNVDAVTYLKAIKMFKDVDWREMFMAMSEQRRLDWLGSLDR